MDDIRVFNFQSNEVRVVKGDNGEPWFVAKDVCAYFGETNYRRAIQSCDEEEKGVSQITTPGGPQNMTIVNESGLYSLLFAMRPSKARGVSPEYIKERQEKIHAFKRWVTHEVLPSIRKHGGYIASNGTESVEELYMRAMESLHAALERQKAITAEQTKQLEKQAPDVEYCNTVLAARNLHTVNSIATHLGTTAVRLNRLLSIHGWIYRKGGIYYPSASIRDKGYCDFHVVPYVKGNGQIATREHLKWTEEGRRFVINFYHTVMG